MTEVLVWGIPTALWNTLIAAVVTITIGYLNSRTKAAVDAVKVAVEENKAVVDQVHVLVNSNMGVALNTAAKSLRSLANLSKRPRDAAAADEAEKMYADHQAQQAIVDAVHIGNGTPKK